MEEQELLNSIQLYNDQLSQVSCALQNGSLGSDEKQKLEELQQSLIQLLELTLDQLQQHQAVTRPASELTASVNSLPKTEEEIRLEEELALFKSEIAELDGPVNEADLNIIEREDLSDEETPPETTDQKDAELNNEQISVVSLLSRNESTYKGFSKAWTAEEVHMLEGSAVCAPYTEEWGGHTYHNAIVMSVGHPDSGVIDLACPEVVVLFSQPTSLSMLPCRYFLSDSCRFNDSCQYSHGAAVAVHMLRPYTAPCSTSLKVGSRVLCRHSASSNTKDSAHLLWHPGVVDAILSAEELVSVQCTPCRAVVECPLDYVVQIPNDLAGSTQFTVTDAQQITLSNSRGSESDEEPLVSLDSLDASAQSSEWILTCPPSSALGDWEKYTKGIGSKLMQSMGYVVGTGLGKCQDGRVEPVPAYLYPPGVSLDRCMELRERGGGEDLLQVEKRLKKEQLKEEKRQKREEERIAANTSVFDIINNQLAGPVPTKDRLSKGNGSVNVDRSHLKTNSSRELNMKGYQLDQRSAELEREITHLSASMARQAPRDKDAAQNIQKRIQQKKEELEMTKRAQARVSSEQDSRREKKKYVVF